MDAESPGPGAVVEIPNFSDTTRAGATSAEGAGAANWAAESDDTERASPEAFEEPPAGLASDAAAYIAIRFDTLALMSLLALSDDEVLGLEMNLESTLVAGLV
ncbi:MAG: hypothetical protein WAK29_07275 [Terriglobales bacterium]